MRGLTVVIRRRGWPVNEYDTSLKESTIRLVPGRNEFRIGQGFTKSRSRLYLKSWYFGGLKVQVVWKSVYTRLVGLTKGKTTVWDMREQRLNYGIYG